MSGALPATVLFVDDEPALLDTARRTFRGEPFRLLVAADTRAARDTLARVIVDVLVCDHMMPGARGTEFLAEVRLTYPEVIPMMLTGTADVRVAADAITTGGVFRFFTKPCDVGQLAYAIRQALDQRDAIREAQRLLRHAVPDPAPTGADRRALPAGILGASGDDG